MHALVLTRTADIDFFNARVEVVDLLEHGEVDGLSLGNVDAARKWLEKYSNVVYLVHAGNDVPHRWVAPKDWGPAAACWRRRCGWRCLDYKD